MKLVIDRVAQIDRFKQYERYKKSVKPKGKDFAKEYEKAIKEYCKENNL